jgi:hypothetical protein
VDYVFAVDPGERKIGLALFRDAELIWAGHYICGRVELGESQYLETAKGIVGLMAERRELWEKPGDTVTLAVEEMVARRGRVEAWDSLMEISRMTGALSQRFTDYAQVIGCPWTVRLIDPGRWTRRLAKEKHQERTKLSLTVQEQVNIVDPALSEAPKEAHSEIIDAVGIGLFVVGRG